MKSNKISPILNNESYNLKVELSNLSSKLKENKTDYENLKNENKQSKKKYNEEFNYYNQIKKNLSEIEKKYEKFSLKIDSINSKQKILLSNFNHECFNYFKQFFQKSEIFEGFFVFVNYENKKKSQLFFLLSNKDELITLLFNSFQNIKFLNKNENDLYNKKKEKIEKFFNENKNKINYPFDILYEFILNCFKIINLLEESEKYSKEIDELTEKKNKMFVYLKVIENEIFKNDNFLKNYENYLLNLDSLNEKYKQIFTPKKGKKSEYNFDQILEQFKNVKKNEFYNKKIICNSEKKNVNKNNEIYNNNLNNNNKNKNNNKDSNSNKKDNKLISINKIQVIKNYNSSNAFKNINKNLTNIKNYIKFHINNNNNNNNSKNNNNNKKENILIKNRNNNTLNYNNFKKNQTLKSFSIKKNLLNNNNNIFNNINNHIFEHNNNKNFTNRKKENKTKNNKNVNEIVNKKIPKINKLNYSSKKPFYSLKINKEQKINSPQIEVFPIKKEMMNSIFSSVPKKEASVEEFTMNDSLLNSIKEDEKLNINEFNDNNLICNENKPFVYIKI